uniref:helix-turn-helix domain-containing protein n=1 Tax=Janthinobacterium sp. TaxID=1871054 RepID=UPI001866624C|nr:helix-turn-helix domain-containing protein [Janthinobacterium sp.]
MPSLLDDNDMAAAMARYDARNGFAPVDPKVTPLRGRGRPRKVVDAAPPPGPKPGKRMTPDQLRDKQLAMYKLQPLKKAEGLPAYDVTDVTRYPAVPEWKAHKNPNVTRIWQRYSYAMPEHSLSPASLKLWREHVAYMSLDQVAQMVRVDVKTVRNWESGKSAIPFTMWWVMSCTLQDPEFFLDRPGFHDFYIEYDRDLKQPMLCSRQWPDIRCSPTDLYVQRAATSKVFELERRLEAKQLEVDAKQRELDEMAAENTRLRQMLKAGTVAAELAAMHEHIGSLLTRMHTADVVEFPTGGEVRQFAQAAG